MEKLEYKLENFFAFKILYNTDPPHLKRVKNAAEKHCENYEGKRYK